VDAANCYIHRASKHNNQPLIILQAVSVELAIFHLAHRTKFDCHAHLRSTGKKLTGFLANKHQFDSNNKCFNTAKDANIPYRYVSSAHPSTWRKQQRNDGNFKELMFNVTFGCVEKMD
jgi:hypothetical protein